MNDRYLFKAKSADTGEWIIGSYHHRTDYYGEKIDEHFIIDGTCTDMEGYGEHYIIDPKTLCQCTSLKDKDGNLIFENDIVVCDGCVGIVKFGYYEWSTSENVGFYIDWEEVYFRKDLAYWLDKIKVVGSIIDNPKLLEVE